MFSSLASILGGLGMAGYDAANRYLDAEVAEAPDAGGVPIMAVNFDDWDFDYSKEQVGAFVHTRKGLSIPPEDGLAIIEAVLGTPGLERVVVSATPCDLQALIDINNPVVRARYEFAETGEPSLGQVVKDFLTKMKL
jgi:hypothetical protein